MLYNIVLISAKHQHESATGARVPSLLDLPPASHPIPSLQVVTEPGLSPLSYTANSHSFCLFLILKDMNVSGKESEVLFSMS